MGIMLLLTLMLCLQIVENPGIADVQHDVQTLASLTSASQGLQSQLLELEQAVSDNAALLDAGALVDVEILNDLNNKALNSNQRTESALRQLAERTQKANDVSDKLSQYARTSTTPQKTKQLKTSTADAQRILKTIQQGRRVTYRRPAGSNQCWLVEISTASDVRAAMIGRNQTPKTFPSIEHCRDWMVGLKNQADFLIVIKPATWDLKAPLEKVCQTSNITYAFDLLPQDQVALDHNLGAGL